MASREETAEDMERRLHMASVLAAEQENARTAAERESEDYRRRLGHLVEETARGLSEPVAQLRESPLRYPTSAAKKQLDYGASPTTRGLTSPLTPGAGARFKAVGGSPATATSSSEDASEGAPPLALALGAPLFFLALAAFANRCGDLE